MAAVAGGAFTVQRNKNSSTHKTLWVGFLNEVSLRPWFKKSLDLQVSFLRGYFKENIARGVFFKEAFKSLEESVLF